VFCQYGLEPIYLPWLAAELAEHCQQVRRNIKNKPAGEKFPPPGEIKDEEAMHDERMGQNEDSEEEADEEDSEEDSEQEKKPSKKKKKGAKKKGAKKGGDDDVGKKRRKDEDTDDEDDAPQKKKQKGSKKKTPAAKPKAEPKKAPPAHGGRKGKAQKDADAESDHSHDSDSDSQEDEEEEDEEEEPKSKCMQHVPGGGRARMDGRDYHMPVGSFDTVPLANRMTVGEYIQAFKALKDKVVSAAVTFCVLLTICHYADNLLLLPFVSRPFTNRGTRTRST
jgi:hypothetical protein